MIRNKKVTKEEFNQVKSLLSKRSLRATYHQEFLDSMKYFPQKNMIGRQNQHVYGNYVVQSKNSPVCFDSWNMEDNKYCTQMFMESKDCVDCDECGSAQLLYNCNNL
jgi:hypothetical protein